MALSKEQRLLLATAGLLLAGETIAEEAHEPHGHGEGGFSLHEQELYAHYGVKHHGYMHVKTPKGAAFFKLPIGSLIIPHAHGTKEVAEQALENGTHHLVQQGDQDYAVHNQAKVYVQKTADLDNPVETKHAAKIVVNAHPETHEGEHVMLHQGKIGDTFSHSAASSKNLEKYYTELPPGEPKKAVSIKGKHAAWVPATWKVYQNSNTTNVFGKFAKDPQGNWHSISPEGIKNATNTTSLDNWVSNGTIVPDNPSHELPKSAVLPHHEEKGPSAAKVDVGGVAATKEDIKSAIFHLNEAKSTNVKGPLKSKGHPLQHMDYMAISKKELAEYPELKVDKGTKKQHVGQVKLAVLHHLAGKLQELDNSEAESHVAEHVQEKAKAEADHAAELTPHSHEWGGVHASKEDLQQAIDLLEETQNTHGSFKAALKKLGNPLVASDYMAVAKAYKSEHPNSSKGLNTKQLMLADLKEHLSELGTADAQTGHDTAVAVDKAVEELPKDKWKSNWSGTENTLTSALQKALMHAGESKDKVFVMEEGPSSFWLSVYPPHHGEPYWVATPEHKLLFHKAGDPESSLMDLSSKVPGILGVEGSTSSVEPVSPEKWKSQPGWDKLHKAVLDLSLPGKIYTLIGTLKSVKGEDSLNASLSLGMFYSANFDTPRYVKPLYENYVVASLPPSNSLTSYYEILPDLRVTFHGKNDVTTEMSIDQLQAAVDKASQILSAKESLTKDLLTKKPQVLEEVAAGGETYLVPKDYSAWKLAAVAGVFVQKPSGAWGHHKDPTTGEAPVEDSLAAQVSYMVSHGTASPLNDKAKSLSPDKFGGSKPEKVDAPTSLPNTVKVAVEGKEHSFPEGSKVYVPANNWGGNTYVKHTATYVKLPDGTWSTVEPSGNVHPTHASSEAMSAMVEQSSLVEKSEKPKGEESVGAAQPVIVKGKVLGEVPAGSVFYKYNFPDNDNGKLQIKDPQGAWYTATNYGGLSGVHSAHVTSSLESQLSDGKLVKVEPPTAEEVVKAKNVAALKEFVSSGAIQNDDGSQFFPSMGAALAKAISGSGFSGDTYVYKAPSGEVFGWSYYKPSPIGGTSELWEISLSDLTGKSLTDGKELPFSKVKEEIEAVVIPNAVVVDGEVYKHGFYKSSKSTSYLEIKPQDGSNYKFSNEYNYGTAAKASYVWHNSSGGVKLYSPSQAAAQLKKNLEYFKDEPEIAEHPLTKVSYATTYGPGDFYMWSSGKDLSQYGITVHQDGTGHTSYNPPLALHNEHMDNIVATGGLLDKFGNTVVRPGVKPAQYHLFGGVSKSAEELKTLQSDLQKYYHSPSGLSATLKVFFGNNPAQIENVKKFSNEKLVSPKWDQQRDSILSLLNEMLSVPEQKFGSKLGPSVSEVKFLKTAPEGISSSKDVFDWLGNGYAKPYQGVLSSTKLSTMTGPELTQKIKSVSSEFGGGKVVGTHPSALKVPEKASWLKAFSEGDMVTVFNLDASGGKVSPMHPGAPKNEDTHHVDWAPWDPGQVPASKTVEGSWTPLGTQPSMAEINNYLIKMEFKHAVYLSPNEKRQVVKSHRDHNQDAVDSLTRDAQERFNSGAEPLSEPPSWTDNVKPAKSYDIYLEEQKAPGSWNTTAVMDFAKDYHDELLPFAEEKAKTSGSIPSTYFTDAWLAKPLIADYLDAREAEIQAEKLRPRYELVPDEPGIVKDQFDRRYTWFTGTKAEMQKAALVANLTRAWGYRTPSSELVKLEADGTPGVVSPELNPTGTLAYLPGGVGSLTDRQLTDIAKENVLDYALANPTSTPGSYLLMGDGGVLATDRSDVFTGLQTWDALDPFLMNSSTKQPVSLIFDAMKNGDISKQQADDAYVSAVRAAKRMQSYKDDKYRGLLESVLHGSDVVDGLVERKNSLADSIDKLWSKAYEAAGWTKPEVPEAKLSHGLHSGFSEPEFAPHVLAAKSFGAPAFFADSGIVAGNVLVWTELAGAGHREFRGELVLRGSALNKAVAWANSHTGDASTLVPKNEIEYHNDILSAAKAVSDHAHDQLFDGPITAGYLSKMQQDKQELTMRLHAAEAALEDGPGSTEYEAVLETYGDPVSVVDMAKYYLSQIEKVNHGKLSGGTFEPSDFPGWKSVDHSAITSSDVKIDYKKVRRELGTDPKNLSPDTWQLNKETGELQIIPGKTTEYPGYAWQITLPTGEIIEVNDQGQTQTPLSQSGRIRFRALADDGSASLERIRAFLQDMGVGMNEATDQDMENLYWRQLAWVLSDRADRKEGNHIKVWNDVSLAATGKPASATVGPGKKFSFVGELPQALAEAHLTPEEEAAAWRKAFSNLTSAAHVDQFVENKGYLPHLFHHNIHDPEVPGGKPEWYRFDVSPEDLSGKTFLTHSFYDSSKDPHLVVRSGGLYASEARLRALGTHKTGMSWSDDMAKGSAGFVFTRQNLGSGGAVYISPRVMARMNTYAFGEDKFGLAEARRTSAYFNIKKATSFAGSSNEAMIQDAVTLLDDIELIQVSSSQQKQQIINDLKAKGVTSIRGLPVSDRVATIEEKTSALAKVKAHMQQQAPSWFDRPESEWEPAGPGTNVSVKAPDLPLPQVKSVLGDYTYTETPDVAGKLTGMGVPTDTAKLNHLFSSLGTDAVQAKKMTIKNLEALLNEKYGSVESELSSLANYVGLKVPDSWGGTKTGRIVGALISSWAQSQDSSASVALQKAAKKLFDISASTYGVPDTPNPEDVQSALEKFLLAQWNTTQSQLMEHGIDNITVYRAFHFNGAVPEWAKQAVAGSSIPAPESRPMSSWATSQNAAEDAATFATGGKTVVVQTVIPRQLALSYPGSGFGALSEKEIVALHANGSWKVVSVSG